MSNSSPFPLIAVDIGNARMKFGLFESLDAGELPEPVESLQVSDSADNLDDVGRWLDELGTGAVGWWIGSVNRPTAGRLVQWLGEARPEDRVTLLAAGDLPLDVGLERPDMVGIDRLIDAVAANQLRQAGHPAIVVDLGSAITVDLISADGRFEGGAILPGIAMSARAMHKFTDLLPLVEMSELVAPPNPLGTSTLPAMRSGLFWGAVGAIRELIDRLSTDQPDRADVFLSGGAGPAVAQLLGPATQHVPHLTMAGIALTAAAGSS
jgi:type III pantothenate kinase